MEPIPQTEATAVIPASITKADRAIANLKTLPLRLSAGVALAATFGADYLLELSPAAREGLINSLPVPAEWLPWITFAAFVAAAVYPSNIFARVLAAALAQRAAKHRADL